MTMPIGILIADNRRGDSTSRLMRTVTDGAGIVPDSVIADGWQLAEYPGTGYRKYVRIDYGQGTRQVRNWSYTPAYSVEIRDVDTVVEFYDGGFRLMAGLGKPSGYGLVRQDEMRRLARHNVDGTPRT